MSTKTDELLARVSKGADARPWRSSRTTAWAAAASVALLLIPAAVHGQAMPIDRIDDPRVIEAFRTIGAYFGGEIAVVEMTIVDASGEPVEQPLFDSALASPVSFPVNLGALKQIDSIIPGKSITLSGSATCKLKEAGGDYYWVPAAPHCPHN
jgi:hypothetical protein